jgi:16S rRNA (guanine527-N7)-methyltransferase
VSREQAYATELEVVLPADLPYRERVVQQSAKHLELVAEANEHVNLTRILEPREAAVKHVLDSVAPWGLMEPYRSVMDLGSGAGFPGIPLALAFPDKKFLLAESVGKKARFIEEAAQRLELRNVETLAQRAEEALRGKSAELVVIRAVGSTAKLLRLLGPVIARTKALLLYKGPEPEEELAEAAPELKRLRLTASVSLRYELPYGYGSRSIIEIKPLKAR